MRDRDWGTLEPELVEISRDHGENFAVSFRATYHNGKSKLLVNFHISAGTDGIKVAATGAADGDFETNRAGFTVLHPASVAGRSATVHHSDGSVEESAFPDRIDPWQPFMDITALTHDADGLAVTCAFQGDTFEMEDQRQWGDASFKTYNRPLALSWPYQLGSGVPFSQEVSLSWKETRTGPTVREPALATESTFPEMALVLTADEATRLAANPDDLAVVGPQRLLCHLDASLGATADKIVAFANLQKVLPEIIYDLELVCPFESAPQQELNTFAQQIRDAGFTPESVLVCPSVDRQSTPPGSDWPDCPPLKDIHAASAKAFPDQTRGGGMVSFFPELNRKRPPVEMLDFVSHGLCPIVHAADDVSVMETLEAIPHITRSARAICGETDYRIGPCTIAMRQNPYGQSTIPNANNGRVCMTDNDPRHRAAFGAAYALGLAVQLAGAGVTVWTPSGLYGPRGLFGTDSPWPIAALLRELAGCAGQAVLSAGITDGIATLTFPEVSFRANLADTENQGLGPYAWERLEALSTDRSSA